MMQHHYRLYGADGSAKILHLDGRPAWALKEMIEAGGDGVTAIDYPGVRVADAVFKLRKIGIVIDTIHEAHGGDFKRRHARYVLRSKVELSFDLQVAA